MAQREPGRKLLRAAILLALMEAPALGAMPDELEKRVAELLKEGEAGLRRRGIALRAQGRN